MTLSVLHVVSEAAPFARTGALADVCSALPRALARAGEVARVTVIMPRYRAIDPSRHALARRLTPLELKIGGQAVTVNVYEGKLPGGNVPVFLIDHPLFDREGLYGEGGVDYPDNAQRFGLLGKAALELAHKLDLWPDVLHAHDWQGGLVLSYAKRGLGTRPVPATVLTIHNLAFQGLVAKALIDELDVGWEVWTPDVAEFFGQLSLLKLGIASADRLTTVSPRYAREITGPEQGAGLDGFLRARQDRLAGILNGIDTEVWDPVRDPHIAVRYDADDRTGKAADKMALQREVGLPVRAGVPLVGMISRMVEAKGFGLLIDAGAELARLEMQFVFLGKGERRFEGAVDAMARRQPGRFAAKLDDNAALEHRIHAGADFYLMPSLVEPCGLHQMHAHRYGTIPIVRATGGLDDTVVDYDERTRTGTGFKFAEASAMALTSTLKRALALYRHRDALSELSSHVMRLDHGWQVAARRYRQLYEELLSARKAA